MCSLVLTWYDLLIYLISDDKLCVVKPIPFSWPMTRFPLVFPRNWTNRLFGINNSDSLESLAEEDDQQQEEEEELPKPKRKAKAKAKSKVKKGPKVKAKAKACRAPSSSAGRKATATEKYSTAYQQMHAFPLSWLPLAYRFGLSSKSGAGFKINWMMLYPKVQFSSNFEFTCLAMLHLGRSHLFLAASHGRWQLR